MLGIKVLFNRSWLRVMFMHAWKVKDISTGGGIAGEETINGFVLKLVNPSYSVCGDFASP